MSAIFFLQGIFYLATGIWPLIHIDSFLMITGPKVDIWLVKTVGVLVAVIGLALLSTGLRRNATVEMFILAVLSAVSLASMDVIYVSNNTIDPIYLLDAIVEVLIVLIWMLVFRFQKRLLV